MTLCNEESFADRPTVKRKIGSLVEVQMLWTMP